MFDFSSFIYNFVELFFAKKRFLLIGWLYNI